MKAMYINSDEFKKIEIAENDSLRIGFSEETASYGGQKIKFLVVRLKCASGIEEISVMSNFEVRLHGVKAIRVGDKASFTDDFVRLTVSERVLLITSERRTFEIHLGNDVEFFA